MRTRTTHTTDSGAFFLGGLPIGTYSIEIAHPGFNIFNRAQYADSSGDVTVPAQFGIIQSTVNTGPIGTGTPASYSSCSGSPSSDWPRRHLAAAAINKVYAARGLRSEVDNNEEAEALGNLIRVSQSYPAPHENPTRQKPFTDVSLELH